MPQSIQKNPSHPVIILAAGAGEVGFQGAGKQRRQNESNYRLVSESAPSRCSISSSSSADLAALLDRL